MSVFVYPHLFSCANTHTDDKKTHTRRFGHVFTIMDTKIFMAGGSSGREVHADAYSLNLKYGPTGVCCGDQFDLRGPEGDNLAQNSTVRIGTKTNGDVQVSGTVDMITNGMETDEVSITPVASSCDDTTTVDVVLDLGKQYAIDALAVITNSDSENTRYCQQRLDVSVRADFSDVEAAAFQCATDDCPVNTPQGLVVNLENQVFARYIRYSVGAAEKGGVVKIKEIKAWGLSCQGCPPGTVAAGSKCACGQGYDAGITKPTETSKLCPAGMCIVSL